MKRNIPTQRYIELVRSYHPTAECKLRETGKEYYQIIDNGNKPTPILGQGKTSKEAWVAAYKNVYD